MRPNIGVLKSHISLLQVPEHLVRFQSISNSNCTGVTNPVVVQSTMRYKNTNTEPTRQLKQLTAIPSTTCSDQDTLRSSQHLGLQYCCFPSCSTMNYHIIRLSQSSSLIFACVLKILQDVVSGETSTQRSRTNIRDIVGAQATLPINSGTQASSQELT